MTPAFVARLSPERARAVAIALLAAAVVVVLALVVGPLLLLHRHYDQAIETLTDRLERFRRVAAQAPELRRTLDAVRTKDGRRFYLRNTAPNLAGAELQELVRGAIENNGGRITTSQTVAPKDDGRFKEIGANLQFFATVPALQRVLNTLETAQPLLVIDSLTIRPVNAFRGFKPAPGQEPEVIAQLEVSAWAYPEAARPVAAGAAAAAGTGAARPAPPSGSTVPPVPVRPAPAAATAAPAPTTATPAPATGPSGQAPGVATPAPGPGPAAGSSAPAPASATTPANAPAAPRGPAPVPAPQPPAVPTPAPEKK